MILKFTFLRLSVENSKLRRLIAEQEAEIARLRTDRDRFAHLVLEFHTRQTKRYAPGGRTSAPENEANQT